MKRVLFVINLHLFQNEKHIPRDKHVNCNDVSVLFVWHFFDDGNHQVIFIKVVEVAGSGMCSKHHGSGVLCSTMLYASMTKSTYNSCGWH